MAPVVLKNGKNRWVVFDPDEKVMASTLRQYTTEAAATKALKVRTGEVVAKPKKSSKRQLADEAAFKALGDKLGI
jgi:hypothetical protein